MAMGVGYTGVCWTIDWQDNYLWNRPVFLRISHEIIRYVEGLLNGKATWFAEVDDLTDVTSHQGIAELVEDILVSGGEVGIHVHHTSVDPDVRRKHYKRAIEHVTQVGGQPESYSAGMGNFIQEDVEGLFSLGIETIRSYAGNYTNATLPDQSWVPPGKRTHLNALFPPDTLMQNPDPRVNPVACDCRGADNRAGYMDSEDFMRILDEGDLFAVPLGTYEGNEDGEYQLHIQPRIPLDRLKRIFRSYHARSPQRVVFVACYFHPYDLLEDGKALNERMITRWEQFVDFQKQLGCEFLTMKEAKVQFDTFVNEGGKHG